MIFADGAPMAQLPQLPKFVAHGKTPRLFADSCLITEKIDGTSSAVYVDEESGVVAAGSRTRWLEPANGIDNYGFGAWVAENAIELRGLGQGVHKGEWYGAGIQRRYGLDHKRFALFNARRWNEPGAALPKCCSVVPTLFEGPFSQEAVLIAAELLKVGGSRAAYGFKDPEGVIVNLGGRNYKYTLDGDGHKGLRT